MAELSSETVFAIGILEDEGKKIGQVAAMAERSAIISYIERRRDQRGAKGMIGTEAVRELDVIVGDLAAGLHDREAR